MWYLSCIGQLGAPGSLEAQSELRAFALGAILRRISLPGDGIQRLVDQVARALFRVPKRRLDLLQK